MFVARSVMIRTLVVAYGVMSPSRPLRRLSTFTTSSVVMYFSRRRRVTNCSLRGTGSPGE